MSRIVIDGNIGSGKSTQLDLLEKKGFRVQKEPIDKWPLKEFYEDPSRWAFYFHMVLLQTIRPLKSSKVVIYERCLLSSRYVFWPVLLNNKTVTEIEDDTYSKFYDTYAWFPDLYIFLAKSSEKCFEHIGTRSQAGDSGVSLSYLKSLEVEYQKLIRNVPCKVIIVDAERPVEEIHKEICRHIEENELLVSNTDGKKVLEESRPRRQVQFTPFSDMCSMS
jgi:deoxyadenosine/deoxycytidine kinase